VNFGFKLFALKVRIFQNGIINLEVTSTFNKMKYFLIYILLFWRVLNVTEVIKRSLVNYDNVCSICLKDNRLKILVLIKNEHTNKNKAFMKIDTIKKT
jgi:hypothetical protein